MPMILAGREIADYRADVGVDDYDEGDPYPKSEERERAIAKYVNNTLLKMLPELTSKQCVVLDAGCGTGDWISHIYEQTASCGHDIYVGEYSETALSTCIARNTFIKNAYLFDANKYPFREPKFDVIISINILEHIESPVPFIKGALSSLKENGVLFISTPSRYRFGNLVRILLGKKPTLIHDLHVTEYTVGQVKEMVHFAGGMVTRVEGVAMTVPGQKAYWFSKVMAAPLQLIMKMLGSDHMLYKTVYYRIEAVESQASPIPKAKA